MRGQTQGSADHGHGNPLGPEEGRRTVGWRPDPRPREGQGLRREAVIGRRRPEAERAWLRRLFAARSHADLDPRDRSCWRNAVDHCAIDVHGQRSEEHTSELQSLMRTSYAVFCLKKKKKAIY